MKFRIVATAKDITIFIIFAIFLLYIVALGVLNLPQLASEGTFYGLNPIEAFSSDYIAFTLVFYTVALGGLFFSVNSYFFEWENGIGFGISSGNSGGYSSWAKAKDIKEDKTIKKVVASDPNSEYAGVPLISNGKELWVDDGEYHTLVIGATGSGKSQSAILPTVKVLAKKGESIICTDPKGEIYEKTGGLLKQRGYNIILLNFRNPQNGNAWNPLSLPYKLYKSGNQDKAIELLDDLALNILYEESSANSDPFWEKTAADYFAGIALAMFEDTTEEKININSINMTATVGEDKFGGSTYIKEYFNYKDPSSAAYVNASGTVMAPSETKGGIISVFKQKVKLFASRENLSEMLSHSDFDLASVGQKPTAIFIIIQDEKKTYHSLATIFIKQVYETLIDVAQASGGKLPVRTNFLLDEFANMPPLKDVTTMITAARSRQIRFTMIIQNFAQLNKVYGKDDAETIKGNCGNIIYLISTELAALEEISKLCGEKKSKKDDKTASTPLATVSDLQRMKQFDEIILRMRKSPFKTSFVPDFKIDWGSCSSPKVDYPTREKKEVEIFDIREFVKNKKNQKINEMMASMGGSSNEGTSKPPMMPPRGILGEGGFVPPSSSNKGKTPDISVSDLVKKIDQKLAEIEKEEQEEKRKKMEAKESSINKSSIARPETKKPEISKADVNNSESRPTLLNKKEPSYELPPTKEYTLPKQTESKKTATLKPATIEKDIELLEDDIETVSIDSNKKHLENDISSMDIEAKVNDKITRDILIDLDDGLDLLAPIEKVNEKKIDDYLDRRNSEINAISSNNKIKEETPKTNSYYSTGFEYKAKTKANIAPDVELEPESNEIKLTVDKKGTENNIPNIKESPKENATLSIPKEEQKDSNKLFKPTATIKLEDVSEDDKFFDDFFDD